MAGAILVVGLNGRSPDGGWTALLTDRVVIARSRAIAEQVIPSATTVTHAYDERFEQAPLVGIDRVIAEDIVRRAESADVAFLVPGPGWIADAIVSALDEITAIEITPPESHKALPAQAQIIDALLLAQAQELEPFDSGARPLDATVPSLIYNWHGQRVIELGSARLRNAYGIAELPDQDHSGMLLIQAKDALESPPSFTALRQITARLRQPDGCPWDRKQTHASMLDDFASEVAEYADAVRAGDWANAAEELGDVLLNILMQAQIGAEAGHFQIEDVLAGINAKLVRRHPHVFAGVEASTPEDVLAVWNSVKQQEKAARSSS